MPISKELANKSVQAAIAAIEIYNKPDFVFREEAFSLLVENAWELLLKAKWLLDNNDSLSSLYETENRSGTKAPKLNRSGNPITFGLTYPASKLLEDSNSGLEKPCSDNILALIEIRDNAVHFINKDLYFGRRVLEIGAASLRNYLLLITEWFQMDLTCYNVFLMPISVYHGFETAAPVTLSKHPEQLRKLIEYLDNLESQDTQDQDTPIAKQHVALHLETKLIRGKDQSAISFRWTDDPSAPAVTMKEEDILKNCPLTYRQLCDTMRRRYSEFLENREFHRIRAVAEKEKKYSIVRLLHPGNIFSGS